MSDTTSRTGTVWQDLGTRSYYIKPGRQTDGIGVTSKIRLQTVVASVLGILSAPTPRGNQLPCHQAALWRGPRGKEPMSLANSRQGLRPPTTT